jgi:prepilin-type N-terminal cleavage/methylation domain-containing protein
MAAFTIVELLVVMAIIGVLASMALPHLKGFGKGTGMAGAQRQLLQDINLARLSAINGRTTVCMVFVPTNIVQRFVGETNPPTLRQLTNLISGQYTAYALLSKRTVGDQPGRDTPRYLTEWRYLPQGVLIPTIKFDQVAMSTTPALLTFAPDYRWAFDTNWFPFPNSRSRGWFLPYIAFNSEGQLVKLNLQGQVMPRGRDELLPLAEGGIFYLRNSQGAYASGAPDVVMKPPDNYTNRFIRISWLTGRASVDEATRPKFR